MRLLKEARPSGALRIKRWIYDIVMKNGGKNGGELCTLLC